MTEPARQRDRLRHALVVVLAATLAGCDLPGKPDPADQPVTPAEVVDFGTLYRENCSGCHGADGRLGPAPPLNDTLFLAIVPDQVLLNVIAAGRPGTPMPAFARARGGPLTGEQVRVLAQGIRKQWQVAGQAPEGLQPYRGAPGNRRAGDAAYMRACAVCHGMFGEGASAGAINDPDFLRLISVQALRRYVITGRPDLGMPPHDSALGRGEDFKPLSSKEVTDLVALLASWKRAATPDRAAE